MYVASRDSPRLSVGYRGEKPVLLEDGNILRDGDGGCMGGSTLGFSTRVANATYCDRAGGSTTLWHGCRVDLGLKLFYPGAPGHAQLASQPVVHGPRPVGGRNLNLFEPLICMA